jgi:hypothetical protein
LPERSRKLLTRVGFFSPSLDGGLPLFELFNLSRRSSSAIHAFRAAFPAISAATSAIASSLEVALGASRIIRFLNRKPTPPPRKIYPAKSDRDRLTWEVTRIAAPCRRRARDSQSASRQFIKT